MTLALLLTAATGAWAETETLLTTINASSDFTSGSKTFDNVATVTFEEKVSCSDYAGWYTYGSPISVTVAPVDGVTITSVKFFIGDNSPEDTQAPFTATLHIELGMATQTQVNDTYYDGGLKKIEVYGTAEAPVTVAWTASTKTGTFTMPGSDVVLTPIYANAAAFATTGTEPDVKTLLPEAAEGVIAGTDASLIAEGTGIVANIGETTTAQGTLMYAIGTSATEAPALTAFSATAPTAKNVADDGADVYVWYYIQGADAPQGEAATLDNTFNDTEPACLTVQVLTNKFDITFNAANANTIEAGKATVTVDGTDKTSAVTEGKLQGVKMGSEVKLKAATGYKFRKVEVKKNDGSTRLDESTVGMIVCTNGKAYPVNMKDNLPSGVTAVGIVAYKNGKNGLVMALTDEATNMNWDTATGNNGAKAHTPVVEGYTWKVPTIYEWQYNIFSGSGVSNLAGLSTYMTAAGGTGLQEGCYWTSTPKNNSYYARCIKIENGSINFSPGGNTELKSNGYHVRAVFAF